ncbi:hypothetical protein KM043_006402 [Ampulex compressa]|uniref:Venom protein n=1 Tax=Ampulex compressa TaxID=860918 RepID=A0A1W6EWD4_AMPCP|nr:venom protein [Ampulex compressa]KAG7190286.1 hypothetical protein KM043_006402 [Ampulex compressa]
MSRIVFVLLIAVAICSAKSLGDDQNACGVNEVFTTCGTACEPSCGNLELSVCTYQCTIGCQCNAGYVRNSNKECVKPEDC